MSDTNELFDATPVEETTVPAIVADNREDALLAQVLTSGNIEILKEYIALRNAQEEREAKRLFDVNFSLMQKDFKPVPKTKEVKNRAGEHMYFYAPIEDLVKVNGEAILSHGFSWRFESETIKEGEIREHCIISGYGHERSAYFDTVIDQPTAYASASKQRAGAATFGQRYAFKGAFGMTVCGEDNEDAGEDKASASSADKLRPMLEEMAAQTTAKALMDVYIKHFKALVNDKAGQSELLVQKNNMMKLVSP